MSSWRSSAPLALRGMARSARDSLLALAGKLSGRDQPLPGPIFNSPKSVLVIEGLVPQPDRNAGDRNIFEFVKTLVEDGWTVAFWPMSPLAPAQYVEQLQSLGATVVLGKFRPTLRQWLRGPGRGVRQILLCRPYVAEHYLATALSVPDAHVSYYGHDLHYARLEMQAEVTGTPALLFEAASMKRQETAIWERVDVALYPTQEEADVATALNTRGRIQAVQIFCFDEFRQRESAPADAEILFVAGFRHAPNVDAALWLCQEILPAVWAAVPHARVSIIGSSPPPEVLALAGERVTVRGWVSDDDLIAAYGSAKVAVVPLRYGAGLKLKVVEALVYGVPLVTTSVGAQGLPELPDIASVADEPGQLAAAIAQQLTLSDDRWLEQSGKQVGYAHARFSRATMLASLLAAFATPHRPR